MQEIKLPQYAAAILLKLTSDMPNHKALYDETIVLIKASSEEDAMSKALEYGSSRGTTYKNEAGYDVTLSFERISKVDPITENELCEVTEVWGRFFHDFEAYKRMVDSV